MANAVRLNHLEHKDLRVNSKNSVKLGDKVTSTLTYPSEFINIQREYPILFSKHPQTGDFQSVVLLGLEKDENLFLKRGKWQANYIPAVIAKGPFLIGFEPQEIKGQVVNSPVIYIDIASPRVSHTSQGNAEDDKLAGEALFLENGEQSPYLQQVAQALATINDGANLSKAMFDAFSRYDLIEAVNLDITLNNGRHIKLSGNYTIHEEKLAALDGNALEQLNKAGFLSLAFAVVSSLANVRKLVDLKNAAL
ncbi:SapC family protein [Thalassomonas actiniarum]|uniref:SapC family protein n=1 Tax=Thalassomonas actiniarum TaxID=485447 RepID=A0AAE9YLF2_9GAMM|nr:SapC family protein [Thalassomonas actiniarum]WDD97550.1 SapC family protein [Thalassomonas actiniarum]